MTSYNQWRAASDGEPVKNSEDVVGMGQSLPFMRGKLGSFDDARLDASTTLFGK